MPNRQTPPTPSGSFSIARGGPRLVLEGPSLILALLSLVVLAAAPWIYLSWSAGPAASTNARPNDPLGDESETCRNPQRGPWGCIETTDIVISPPLEFVSLMADLKPQPEWHFRNSTPQQLRDFLAQLPFDPAQREAVAAASTPDREGSGLVAHPSEELIWSLSPQARGALYHALALDTNNLAQSAALRFAGTLDQWLAGSGVSDETLKLTEKLLYRQNKSIFLADAPQLMARLPEPEQTRLLKALSGQRTLVVRLRVTADDDLSELVEYWGHGRRSKDVRPVLESLAKVPGGGIIDVSHLLPAFARTRLYTYATPTLTQSGGALQNCHWTALNFFAREPDDRFTDVDFSLEEIRQNYHPVYNNPRLGDLVVFGDKADPMFHVAVYVADDILFTKNGNSFSLPWMYMRLEQLKDFYARPFPVEVKYFRQKDL
jgi:hypothetical protein